MYIGAFAAVQLQLKFVAIKVVISLRNTVTSRFSLNFDALAGQLIQRLTIMFERRVHRWYLLDRAAKRCKGVFHLIGGTRSARLS